MFFFAQRAEDTQAVQSIVAKMQNRIRAGYYSPAVGLMSNYVYAKGDSLKALFPSVLEDLGLGNPLDDNNKNHVEELLRELSVLSLKTWFRDFKKYELLAIATDNLDAYKAMANEKGYKFTQQRALAAALAGSVEVFKFMEANSDLKYDSDLFNAALVGGNQELVHLCTQNGADKTWSFNCFEGEGFIKDNLFLRLINQDKELEKEVASRFLLPVSAGGRLNFVKYLVEECGADVEAKGRFGVTPLIWASLRENLDVVKYLVEQCHANVEAEDEYGGTPLISASLGGYLEVVKYLVEQCGADVGARKHGWTPLFSASSGGHLEVLKYLHEQSHADVETKDKDGGTLIHYASWKGHLDVVKYLVEECHADVEAKDILGRTPLIGASLRGNLDVVKYLVEECHADVEAKNNDGYTPLIGASLRGNLDVVKYLVENGANANPHDGTYTPLSKAARFREMDIVKYLVEQGHAKITDKAISEAGTDEIKDYLRSKKAEQDAQK